MIYSIENGYTENELKIIDWVHTLAQSQGFYCRVWEEITSNREALRSLADQNFTDCVDMVLFLECA